MNLGNTCFLNSVLQCLSYSPPLAEYCLAREHRGRGTGGFDALGSVQQHVNRVFRNPGSVISPSQLVRGLRQVSKSFRNGRQEDAHEYARCLIDRMKESNLKGISPKPTYAESETCAIHRMFGFRLCSTIRCTSCGYRSETHEPAMDLSLEVLRAKSLHNALAHFTSQELLDGSNKYKCPRCHNRVRAVKQFTVDINPNILTVQLKRFDLRLMGGKIDKWIEYPKQLNLGPYTTARGKVLYNLYGVLVHSGHSVHSGHYYCFVKSPAGAWLCCDDATVRQVSEKLVLAQKAYMLFYVKDKSFGGGGGPEPGPSSAAVRGAPGPYTAREAQKQKAQAGGGRRAKRGRSASASPEPPGSPPRDAQPKLSNREIIITRAKASFLAGSRAAKHALGKKKLGSKLSKLSPTPHRNTRWKQMLLFLPKMRLHVAAGTLTAHALKHQSARQVRALKRRLLAEKEESVEAEGAEDERSGAPTPPSVGEAEAAPARPLLGKEKPATRSTRSKGRGKASAKDEAPAGQSTSGAKLSISGVKSFLLGDQGQGQFGVEVGTWGEEALDAATRREAQELVASQRPRVRPRDAYDEEYDRGKAKKRRSGPDAEPSTNAFQHGPPRNAKASAKPGGKRAGRKGALDDFRDAVSSSRGVGGPGAGP